VTAPAIGFIGFGEAAYWIAKGLGGAGITNLAAFDINAATPVLGDVIQQRARESGTDLVDSARAVASRSEIILSAVTAAAARQAGEGAAHHLETRHLYVDINSVAPSVKQAVDRAVSASGARFVESAVMAAVPGKGHQAPMLLCGAGARAFAERMTPYGMRLELLDRPVGSAAAVKMFRSVIHKGLEALLLECVLAAEPYGAAERVFASLDQSFPGMNWNATAHYLIGRAALHAQRRAHEMEEVARTLSDLGIEPIMASATAQRMQWCADQDLTTVFGGREPESYQDVVRAVTARSAT
jgi:3-hydroxyisobutyrate dehydrogenase-like beta-hydroxyacid dehydrogenase